MSRLALFLLGPPRIERDGQPVRVGLRKAVALAAYLAVTGRSHTRDTLATLLWPESGQAQARAALRRVLSTLHTAIGAGWLVTERGEVALPAHAGFWLDVEQFHRRLAECRTHGHSAGETCLACLPLLIEAVELYRDDFLVGFTLRDSPLFDEWQFFQTEGLRDELTQALQSLVHGLSHQGELEQAIAYARRWVALDPLDETAHRRLMRLYAQAGQRTAALRQYEQCVQVLAEEVGMSPQARTVQLYQAIRKREALPLPDEPVPPPSTVPPHNLPSQPTPFVGREEELAEIGRLLSDPACRLLTLVGPGGIGKTRLALQTALQVVEAHPTAFAHGVYLVPLAPLSSADTLTSTVADVLRLPFQGPEGLRVQLRNYLREKAMLLVLDNFEHLLEGAELLVEILQHAPAVKVLVTSRERLNLQGEWVLRVPGLGFPLDGDLREAEGYNAVQLFLQGARRARSSFSIAEETPSVVRICQLVEGMPLAIELAAAWVHVLPCAKIATEIERNLGFLASPLRNVPERHRSLQAAFDHSWHLLSEEEKQVCCRLSVFRGGFSREAAERVAGASLLLLLSLVDKSILRWTPSSDRYELHELVRQYATEKLAQNPGAVEETRDRHSEYFAVLLHQQEEALSGRGQSEALAMIGVEIENVRLAWRWAVEQANVEQIEWCLESLYRFYEIRARFQKGEETFAWAAERLDGAGISSKAAQRTVWRLWARQGVFCQYLGRSKKAKERLTESLEAFHTLNDPGEMAFSLVGLVALAMRQGEHSGLKERFEEALALAHAAQMPHLEASGLGQLGTLEWYLGDYSAARAHFAQALQLHNMLGDQRGESMTLYRFGLVSHAQGDYVAAREYLEQALDISREIGDQRGEGWQLYQLGVTAHAQGDYCAAKEHPRQALCIFREIGDRRGEIVTLVHEGHVSKHQGEYSTAQTYFEQALHISREIGNRDTECEALAGLGCNFRHVGSYAKTEACYELALRLAQELGNRQDESWRLAYLSLLAHLQGDDKIAREYSQRALSIAQVTGMRDVQGKAWTFLGHALVGLGELPQAADAYRQAVALKSESGPPHLVIEDLAGLARVSLAQGDLPQAYTLVEEILNHLEINTVGDTDEPLRVYLTCYRVLQAAQDPRAQEVLGTAHRLLQERAIKIEDEDLRRSFLENVAAHRGIVREFAAWDWRKE